MITSIWLIQGLFYLMGLSLYYSGNSFISLWVFMELNLLVFLMFVYFSESESLNNYFKLSLYYFLIQSLGSMYFLISFVLEELNYSFILREIFMILSLSIKIGLFPCAFWVYDISSFLSGFTFFILLTFQKIPYLFILFSCSLEAEFLCFIALIMGSQLIFFSYNLDWLLISSSISSTIWVYFLYLESEFSFYYFFFIYSFCIFPILFGFQGLWRGLKSVSFMHYIYISILFMFLMGLPPFSLFFFKLDISSFVNLLSKDLYMSIFLACSILQFMGYFKMLFKELLFLVNIFNVKESYNVLSLTPFFFSFLPFIFIIF